MDEQFQIADQQQAQDDPKKKLWQKLNASGAYTKSYDEFNNQFNSPDRISKLYSVLNSSGRYTKSQEEFNNQFFADAFKKKVGSQNLSTSSNIQANTNLSLGGEKNQVSQADKNALASFAQNLNKGNGQNVVRKLPTQNQITQVKPKRILTSEEVEKKAQERLNDPYNQLASNNSDDPIGSYYNTIQNSKALSVKGEDKIDDANEAAIHDKMGEIVVNNGFSNAKSASDYLYNQVKKVAGKEIPIKDISIEELKKSLPNNLSTQAALNKVAANRHIGSIMDESKDFNDFIEKYPNLSQKFADINRNTEEGKAQAYNLILNDPDVIEAAKDRPEIWKQYLQERNNFNNKFPDLAKQQIASKISQYREDIGKNNKIFNNPSKESWDKVVDQMYKEGKIDASDKAFYNQNIKPSDLKTTGLLESTWRGYEQGVRQIGQTIGLQDLGLLKDMSKESQVNPTNNKILGGGGHLLGNIVPMLLTGGALKGAGFGEKAANGFAAMLQFGGGNAEESKKYFPNNPIGQFAYTTLGTTIDTMLMDLPMRAQSGIKQFLSKEIRIAASKLSDNAISDAVKEQVKQSFFNKTASVFKRYGIDILKHNAQTAGVLTSADLLHKGLRLSAGDKYAFKGTDLPSEIVGNFLMASPLAAIAAAGALLPKQKSELNTAINELPESVYTTPIKEALNNGDVPKLETYLKDLAEQLSNPQSETITRKMFGDKLPDIATKLYPNAKSEPINIEQPTNITTPTTNETGAEVRDTENEQGTTNAVGDRLHDSVSGSEKNVGSEKVRSYLDVNDITKIENGKSIFSDIYKNKKEGDVFRGVERGELIPSDNVFFVSENPLVAKDYTRAENTSGKYGRLNDKYDKDAKFQRYSISGGAKILDAKTIEGVNELRKILGLNPTDKFDPGWAKVYHLLDGISKEDAQKIKDAGYDAVRVFESNRDTGMSSVDGDSLAIINKDILKENPLKAIANEQAGVNTTDNGLQDGNSGSGKDVGGEKVETDKAVMKGGVFDKVNINDNEISLPEKGFVISDVYLKEGERKGEGNGQELYKKALDEHGVLYSFHPISEDALRVQNKLEEKGIAKIENITLEDGTDARKITKKQPTNEIPISTEEKSNTIKEANTVEQPTEEAKTTNDQSIPIPNEGQPPSKEPPVEGIGEVRGENVSGITHADTAETRKELGLPEYEGLEKGSHEQYLAAARERIAKNPNEANEVMEKYKNGGKHTPEDNAVLAEYKASLDYQLEKNPSKEIFDKLHELVKVLEPAGSEEGKLLESRKLLSAQQDNLSNFLFDKQEKQGAPLSEKQFKEETAKYEELKKIKEDLEKQLAEERAKYNKVVAEKGINQAKAEAKKAAKKSREEYVAERKKIVEDIKKKWKNIGKGGELHIDLPFRQQLTEIAPDVKKYVQSLIEEGVDKLDDIATTIYADLKDVIDGIKKSDIVDIMAGEHDAPPKEQTKNQKANAIRLLQREAKLISELRKARKGEESAKGETKRIEKARRIQELEDKIKEVREQNKRNNIDESPDDKAIGEGELNDAFEKKLLAKAKKLQEDIKNRNFLKEKPQPPVFQKSRKAQILEDRVIDLENKIRHERSVDEYNKRGKLKKAFDFVMETIGIRRLVQAAVDISVPFRQGATLISPRQIDVWGKGFMANIRSVFSPKRFDRIMYGIRHDPMYHDMVKDRVVFNDLGSADPNLHNEDFRKSWIYKIPILSEPLKASNRSADAFLNVARYEMYKKLRARLEAQGLTRESDPKAFQYIGNWVMSMTGRGRMTNMLENSVAHTVLGNTFFGARLMASRFNMLNPVTYFDPRVPKQAKMEAMKDIAAWVTTTMAIGAALGATTGAKISLNPDDSDFLQLRYGKKVYDISGGLAAYIRTFLRMGKAGYIKATGTKYEGKKATDNAGQSVLNFFRNKLSPNTAYATDAFFGKAYGRQFDPYDIVKIYPMYGDDAYKALKEDGAISLATVLLPNLVGIGYGSYASKGQIDANVDDLLQRNLRSDEMNNQKIKNYKQGGRPVTFQEFNSFADKRDEEIKKDIQALFEKGINGKPYKDLTPEELADEISYIKSHATESVKREMFGEEKKTSAEKMKDNKLQEARKKLYK